MPRSSFEEMKKARNGNQRKRKLFENPSNGPKFGQQQAVLEEAVMLPEPMQAQMTSVMEEHAEEMFASMELPVLHEVDEKEIAKKEAQKRSGKTSSITRGNRTMTQMEDLLGELEEHVPIVSEPKKRHWWQKKAKSEPKKETAGLAEYLDVQEKMRLAKNITKGSFSSDTTENKTMLREASKVYVKLIDACYAYLKKAGNFNMEAEEIGLSTKEMLRKEKIIQVLDLARDDISAIQKAKRNLGNIPKEQQSQLNWQDILFSGREATIEVEDYYGTGTLGAGNKTGDNASRALDQGVFTKEVLARVGENVNSVQESISLTFNDRKNILQNDARLGIEESVSGRNAAMSRMAGLLGISGILAESETVKVKDKKTGKIFKGNLMKFAEGKSAYEATEQTGRMVADVTDNIEKRKKLAMSKFTPTVQRDLCSLQILDYICGQNDRHRDNYFLNTDKDGKYTGVQGIDNDMAFGTGAYFAKYNQEDNTKLNMTHYSKMRTVVKENGELSIPYMDNQLAKNIEALEETEIIDALEEFIGPMYIEATLKRFREVKNAIVKERSKEKSDVFKKDNEWNDTTAENMLNKTYFMKLINEKKDEKKENWTEDMYFQEDKSGIWKDYNEYVGESTYFGEMLMEAMGYDIKKFKFLKDSDEVVQYHNRRK